MRNIIGISTALLLASAGTASAAPFTLTSTSFKAGGNIDRRNGGNIMGCTGDNKSPALEWKNPPEGTKSFALMVHDPDAPTGSGFWHWVVYNIPASATELPEGAGGTDGKGLPAGAAQGRTDFGSAGFGGACPPKGDKPHRYIFTVHALKTDKIEVPADASAALVGFMLNANRLAKASFEARYGRK